MLMIRCFHLLRAGFRLSGVLFGKYIGRALPCLNTVIQLPSHTFFHRQHVSIPVLPHAGKSRLVYFKTSI